MYINWDIIGFLRCGYSNETIDKCWRYHIPIIILSKLPLLKPFFLIEKILNLFFGVDFKTQILRNQIRLRQTQIQNCNFLL